jgi:exonuclease III
METVTSHNHKPQTSQLTKESVPKLTKNPITTPLKIYHQNIRGLRCKTNELISHFHPDYPQLLCFTEHHMQREELQQLSMNEYQLAAYFCRTLPTKGGVCMYVHKSLKTESIYIEKHVKEKDLEACAIKLNLNSTYICIITIYTAPSGNFNLFINKLDAILNHL